MSPYLHPKRVVITGMGALSPLGLSMQESWQNAVAGKSGIATITLFDIKDCPVTIAGEVKGFDYTKPIGPFRPRPDSDPITCFLDRKEARKMGRFIHLSLGAASEAYGDSGLDSFRTKISPYRIGVNIGVGMGGLPEIAHVHDDLRDKGYRRITPFFIPQVIPNLASGHISMLFHCEGPNVCNVTACASSAHSIGESFHMIMRGDADIMITGGTEAVVSPLAIGGFASMRALSTRNEDPTRASRPFDKDRDGFVMGEGAAVLVLEEYEHAKKRGAKIYAEILGYGLSGDAYHMTQPAPEGMGGYRAMKMALNHAQNQRKFNDTDVGYINAHGTSTPVGDAEEGGAIRRLLPRAEEHLHISSTKSMTGHLLGAAGALEAAFTAMALKDGVIPPTINLDHLDEKSASLNLNFTPHHAVQKKFTIALSNSFGFGGTNGSLVLGRV